MLKIRRPLWRLIFNMGIAIPGKNVFLIETAPSFQTNCPEKAFHGQVIYSRVAVEKNGHQSREPAPTTTMVYQNAQLDSTRQLVLLTCLRWIKVQPCIFWREDEGMDNSRGEIYVPECLRMVNRNRIVSEMVWVVIGYHGVGNLIILDRNVNADIYVRTLLENLLDSRENIFGAPNCRMVVTRNNLIRGLHNSCLNITVPCLRNLYNSLPRRVRAVIKGRGYPTKY